MKFKINNKDSLISITLGLVVANVNMIVYTIIYL